MTCTGLHGQCRCRPKRRSKSGHPLIVPLHRPQHGPAAHIKHLHEPLVAARDEQLAVPSKLGPARHVLEPRDILDDLARLGRVNGHACPGRHGVPVRARRVKVDVGDGRGVLDEERVPERVEMPRVGREVRFLARCRGQLGQGDKVHGRCRLVGYTVQRSFRWTFERSTL